MLRLCNRYAKDYEEAKDFCIEGWIKIYKNLDEYRNEGEFVGWMKRIMRNTSIDCIRRKKVRERFNTPSMDGYDWDNMEILEEPTYFEDNPMSFDDVLSVVDKLSPRYQEIFKLYYIEGMEHQEIAESLNISVGTSKSNLHKARHNIRKYLSYSAN